MPKVKANNITLNYEQQGSGPPLILLPFLTADNTCYAFQVAEYAKHFTCISIDHRGTGESDKPSAEYSIEVLADDIAALMQALDISSAHISGLSLGSAVGMWLAAKYPDRVRSLSLHSGWSKTDGFVRTVVSGWQMMAKASGSVTETVILGIFPWCFTPDLYAEKPEYVESLVGFVRSRPPQTVPDFLLQADAVINHDVEEQLARIKAPTQITFGRYDLVTSTRFARPMQERIPNSELVIFETCSHAPIYEQVEEFNSRTLEFLRRNPEEASHVAS
jgi:pimeloyl-ACP methyl ester carboxylesterase